MYDCDSISYTCYYFCAVITRVAPTIVTPPSDTVGRIGDAINLTCAVTGVPTPSISWFRSERIVEGAVFQFLYIPSVRLEDRGVYYCRAENSEGTAVSSEAVLFLDGKTSF